MQVKFLFILACTRTLYSHMSKRKGVEGLDMTMSQLLLCFFHSISLSHTHTYMHMSKRKCLEGLDMTAPDLVMLFPEFI